MKATWKIFLLIGSIFGMVLTFIGCASSGKSFKYENIPVLNLGSINKEDYQKYFGAPNSKTNISNSNGEYLIAKYVYAYAGMGNADSRVLLLEFKGDDLNGYVYLSSFDKDRTIADLTKMNRIQKGLTKDQVVEILGKPTGKSICPSNLMDFQKDCSAGNELWIWQSIDFTSSGKKAYSASIRIGFDKEGKVEYSDNSKEE